MVWGWGFIEIDKGSRPGFCAESRVLNLLPLTISLYSELAGLGFWASSWGLGFRTSTRLFVGGGLGFRVGFRVYSLNKTISFLHGFLVLPYITII